MLQHHHTSHCPFERSPPPIPTNWTLTTTTRPPPTPPLPFPSLPLFHYSLSHPSLYAATLVSMGTALGLVVVPVTSLALELDELFFFFLSHRVLSHALLHVFKACWVCVSLGHMISVVRGFRAKLKLEATRLCEKTNQKKGAGKEGCVCVHVCVCVFQECGSLVHACALALSRDCRQP